MPPHRLREYESHWSFTLQFVDTRTPKGSYFIRNLLELFLYDLVLFVEPAHVLHLEEGVHSVTKCLRNSIGLSTLTCCLTSRITSSQSRSPGSGIFFCRMCWRSSLMSPFCTCSTNFSVSMVSPSASARSPRYQRYFDQEQTHFRTKKNPPLDQNCSAPIPRNSGSSTLRSIIGCTRAFT